MKSPTNYGSENEETRFIRRVAAPDRPSNKRRQKKRLAVAGATIGLLAASAGVGYATMRASNASSDVKTAKLAANMANEAFVSKLGDAFHPKFDEIDTDGNGELSKDEILADLNGKETADVKRVMKSDLPDDIKSNLVALLEGKLQSDSDCAKQALDSRPTAVRREDHEIFYYMLDVFCPRVTIAVTPPDQEDESEEKAPADSQQTVEIPTPDGGTAQVLIVGEPEDGKQTIAILDDQGGYTTTEVKSIETPTGEQKILIPNADGDITPVVVPELPADVTSELSEDTQVVDVVTPSGETQQVIVEGEPEHGEQTVQVQDSTGEYVETKAEVVETPSGEEQLIFSTPDGDIIQVPLPEPVPEFDSGPNPYADQEPEPPVVQTVDVVTDNGEHEQVIVVGEVEDGKQTIEVADDQGGYTEKEVAAVETDQGESIVVPDGNGGTTVVNVPDVPDVIADLATDDTQVVNVVNPDNGAQQQVVIEGEPEHGEVTVDIVDASGEVTTEEVKVIETDSGLKLEVPTDDGIVPVVVPDVPAEIHEEIVEEENLVPPVLQTVDIVTASGEEKQVIIEGEPDHGVQTIEIPNEHGDYVETQVKAVETDNGVKLAIPDAKGETTVVTVPDVPAEVVQQASTSTLVLNVETPSGEQQQIIIDGKPQNGMQTVQIVDEHGEVTTEQVKATETSEGEKIVVLTDGGYIAVTIPDVPKEAKKEIAQQQAEAAGMETPSQEETPVVQTVDVVADNGEQQQVILVGGIEDGTQTIEVLNDFGGYTETEVKAIETPEGEKLVVPDAEGDMTVVTVPEVPAEIAEIATEDTQVVNVVTPSGEQQQVVIEGEPEHGEVTIELVDEHGEVTTEEVKAVETDEGIKLVVPTDDGYVPVVVPKIPEEIQQEIVEEQPTMSGGNPFAEEETPVVQTVDVVADNGEQQQVILVGGIEDGTQTIEVLNDFGGYTETEVKAIETPEGEKLVVPDAEGDMTVVTVPEVPAEIAEIATEDTQVVNVVTPSGEQQQVVIEGEPEHGEVTIELVDEHGEVTTEEVKAVETDEGIKLVVPTDDGYVPVVVPEIPEEIQQEIIEEAPEEPILSGYFPELSGENPFTEEETPVVQTVDVVADNGEQQQVILVGGIEDGTQTIEVLNDFGGYTETEVKAIETPEGEKLVVPDAEGDMTVVTVPEVPAEIAEIATEDTQVVNVVTPSGEQQQVVIEGEPEHGEVTIELVDEHGEVTTEEVKAVETDEGIKLVVPTDDGYVPVVVPKIPEEIQQEIVEEQPTMSGGNPFAEEETPVVQTVDVVADNGEQQQVILVGGIEDGTQTIEVLNDFGGYTETEVKAIETPEGEKLVVPDAEGDMTVVTVPEVPAEIAEIATEDTQVVNVVTPSGEQQQVVIEGEPEHGEVTIELVDEHGEVTTEEVKAVETDEGIKLVVPTDDGYVPVVVPEIPEEIQQEIIEEAPEEPILSGYFPELSGENPFTEEETPVVQTVDVVADNGEQQQVILVGGIEDGTQTIEVLNDFGGYTETEVKAIETPEGEKLVVPDAEGDMTVVTVPEVPAEIAEIATEDTQVVNVVTPSGEQQQVVIEGEPEHGEVTIELVDEHGEVTTEEVKAVETDEGIKLVVPTDDGYVPVVVPKIPEEIQQEIVEEQPTMSGGNPFAEEETPVVQTVDVVADNGEQQQVILVGGIEDGTQTIEVLNDFGGYTETEVKAIETPEGEKLVVPDAEGDMTVVTVPEVPAEIAEIATEDTQVVNVVTPSGEQQQVVIEGEPEHGEVTIELVDEHGEVTTEEVKAVETDEGIKLVVPTDDGYVPVVVPEIPEEIQQEIIEEAPEEPILSGYFPELSGENPFTEEETPVVQTVDVVADNGEQQQVILVGGIEDGTQTIEVLNDFGGYTETEVKAIETPEGEKLVVPDAEGDMTVVTVPEVPAEIAEIATEDTQVVNVVTPSGEQQQVVIEGEPEHGEVTIELVDEHGEVTTEEVKAVETDEGIKLVVPTDDGYVPVVVPKIPEEIQQEIVEEQPTMSGGNPFAEEETPVVQTVDVVADNGEQQQVILVGGIEDGTQTIEVLNDFGGYTETEVKAIETPEGEKLVVPDAEGDMTVVTVPEVPAEIAEIATEDTQVVNVVTPSGEQQQVVIEGEPEHGEVTIELVDEHGEVTTEEVKAVETDEGIKLVVPTDDGYVPVVVPKIPEEIQQEIVEEQPTMSGGNPFAEEETPVVQTVDVVADNGEQQQVILVGGIEDGTQTIEVLNDFGGYTETEVKAIETPEGEKLVVPDAEGDMTVVTVPEVPAEIAEIATEDTQVVNVVTPSGEQQQVVIEGEPEHGEVTIELVDEHGEVTTEEVKAVETDEGIKLVVPTDDGYVPVVVPEIPEEIQQEIIEEAPEEPILSGYFPELSGENPFTEEETPVVQTVDVVADNGEQQQVILVGGIEDGTQTIEVLNDFGGYTETEVKAIETPEGEKLVVPDAEGDMTVVTVPEVPAEIAEIATEDTQVVNVVTPSGEQQQVVIEGEPEHGEVTIELVDEHGEVTTEEVKAVETDEGIKLVVPTDDGYVPVVVPKIPEEIQQEIVEEQPTMSGGNPFAEEETPVVQTVDVVADNGEQQQVILVGGIEDGTQTIEVLNDFGGYTETEVKAIETPEGEKLVVPDAEGDMTVVTVPEVPAEIAEIATEDTQVVNVVTPSGEQQQVVIEGEPEHGEVTIELVDEHGEVTTEEVKAVETDEGIKLVVPTDDGYVPVVVPKIPEEIQQEIVEEQPTMSGGNPFAEEETPVVQTVDVVADNGEQQQVILVGGIEDGTQTIEVLNDFGGYTETEVKAIETPEGEKLVVPDAEGDMTVVTVPEVPAEIAEIATEDTQVVNVVTPSGEQQQVVIEGEPEHGEVTIELVDEHGEVTTEEVKAVETDEGIKLVVPTDDGYVPVVVPKIPEEIQQQIMEEASEESKFMTKDEFREWIARRYEDQLSELKKQEQRLKQEEAATTGRVKQLKDCIEQAANKFGYYGVYEQAPHYQNAVEWVENDCWANQWEPESPAEHPMLRR